MANAYQPIFAHFPSISKQYGSMLSLSSNTALPTAPAATVAATTDTASLSTMDQRPRASFGYGFQRARTRSKLCKHLWKNFSVSQSNLSAAVSLDRLDSDQYEQVFNLIYLVFCLSTVDYLLQQ